MSLTQRDAAARLIVLPPLDTLSKIRLQPTVPALTPVEDLAAGRLIYPRIRMIGPEHAKTETRILAGMVDRVPEIGLATRKVKAAVRPWLEYNFVPTPVLPNALVVIGEAVANFEIHTRAPEVCYRCELLSDDSASGPEGTSTGGMLLRMAVSYDTPVFDTAPREVDVFETHGRGLGFIHNLARSQFEWTDGRLTITMEIGW